jgi:DNA-binding transcriptional ArsR family regulator
MVDDDGVFRALADASRRLLLDRLHTRNGQTLGDLCQGMEMSRQAVAKHLSILEEANLVSVRRHGREKLHSSTFRSTASRAWISKFEAPRLMHPLNSKEPLKEKIMADGRVVSSM